MASGHTLILDKDGTDVAQKIRAALQKHDYPVDLFETLEQLEDKYKIELTDDRLLSQYGRALVNPTEWDGKLLAKHAIKTPDFRLIYYAISEEPLPSGALYDVEIPKEAPNTVNIWVAHTMDPEMLLKLLRK